MQTKRQKRVGDQIREILSELLTFEAQDPRLAGVTVMDVDIDRELMYANVYVTALGSDDERTEVLTALGSAAGFLRRELGRRMRIQHTPELRFHWDESLAYGDRIDKLLNSLNSPDSDGDSVDDSTE